MLTRIDAILRWEQKTGPERTRSLPNWGSTSARYGSKGTGGWSYKSFEAYLEAKFPDSRRKAYYLMSIHDHLTQIAAPEIEELGWSKAMELAKVARSEGRRFDSATWLHTAQQSTKQELKEAVHKYFTGEDYEPYEMVYFKLFESQLPVVERALYIATRMVGTEKSRGYCLELVCADFLAGRGEESSPEEILMVIHRLVRLLPREYQDRIAGSGGKGTGGRRKMLKKVKRIKLGKQIYRRLMKRVLERDEWRCQKCGSLENLQVHHKIKRSQLGNDSLDNLVTLCAYCHMGEHGQLFYPVPAVRVCSKPKPRRK